MSWSFISSDKCNTIDIFHKNIKDITPDFYALHLQRRNPVDEKVWEFTIDLMKKSNVCCCKKSFPLVMLACHTISCKFLCDEFYNNNYTAICGGLNVKLLNKLELEILKRLGWIKME